ncbi:MAG: sterol desaturase family protein [Deltaproteobacteria bacterium]|nr:sterol desaturase family protein [Deltaproteobacteria bacterium]
MAASFTSVAIGLVVLATLFGVLERLVPAVGGQPRIRRGTWVDVGWWFVTPLVSKAVSRVTIVLVLVAAAVAAGVPIRAETLQAFLAPRPALAALPWAAQLALFLLVADLLAYASHRWLHVSPRLWPIHAVHHSSTEVDWLSSVRVHPLNDVVTRLAQAVPIVMIGFDPAIVAAYVPVFLFYGVLVHANVDWTFGPLRWVLASPVFHRWHHAAEAEGLNRNFAGLFPVIDLAFGTFHMPRDRRPERFGIPDGDVPETMRGQLAYPFRRGAGPGLR